MKYLIVAHDAGGAEALAAFIRASTAVMHCHVYAEGPAQKVFDRYSIPLLKCLPDTLDQYDIVLTGSSFGAKLENQCIALGKKLGIKTATLLEHWLHYEERFKNCGELLLPDEIWVTDGYAEAIAKQTFNSNAFPQLKIILKPNWYYLEIRTQVCDRIHGDRIHGDRVHGDPDCRSIQAEGKDWLYAMENRQVRGQGWHEALQQALIWAESNAVATLWVRLHPSFVQAENNIQETIQAMAVDHPIVKLSRDDLITDLKRVSGVIGYQTTVLALAIACGKRAVSLVGKEESLAIPLTDIERPRQCSYHTEVDDKLS